MTPQPKTVQKESSVKWNVVVMIGIGLIGVATSQVDRITGKAVDLTKLNAKIESACAEVHRVDVTGCQPSVVVRRDLVALEKDIESNTVRSIENKNDMKTLLSQNNEIIRLLTSLKDR